MQTSISNLIFNSELILAIPKNIRLHLIWKASQEKHIFVLGPPRSGTTLVWRILSVHSQMASCERETFFFMRRQFSTFKMPDLEEQTYRIFLEESRNKLMLFDRIAEEFCIRQNAATFVEKTPEHALCLPQLIKWYPNSHFIFVVRDCRDAFASTKRNPLVWARHGQNYPLLWRKCVSKYFECQNSKNVYLLRYEDLTENAPSLVRSVMDFLGYGYESQQLEPENFGKTPFSIQKGHTRLKDAISNSSVGGWSSSLDESEIEIARKNSYNFMKILKYNL